MDVAAPLDLTPREPERKPRAQRSTRRRFTTIAVMVLLAVAVGFILMEALDSAATFYYNVDQAVAKRPELGDKTIRIQGNVTKATKDDGSGQYAFTLAFNGKSVDVIHTGDTPALFKVGIPVVCQGHFEGARFNCGEIAVKHSASYTAKHPDRVGNGP